MPKATISSEAVRFELKTVPDGFVMIKELPFGQQLNRRDNAARYLQKIDPKNSKQLETQVDILNEKSRQYDFAHCIVDHNLEDDNGIKLDFSNPMTLQILATPVGQEIETYIDKVNGQEFDPETFTSQSGQSSMGTSNGSQHIEESD